MITKSSCRNLDLAEFPVAVVEKVAKRNGTYDVATEYVSYLYSEPAQRLLAEFNYRVHDAKVQAEFAERFPAVELLTVEGIAGGWEQAMKTSSRMGLNWINCCAANLV